jgi:hypothetical protein
VKVLRATRQTRARGWMPEGACSGSGDPPIPDTAAAAARMVGLCQFQTHLRFYRRGACTDFASSRVFSMISDATGGTVRLARVTMPLRTRRIGSS